MEQSVDLQIGCIFLAHQDFVKGLAIHHAPWPGIADDIVQQVFLEFISKKDQWSLQSDVRPLLATMTRYVAKRYWREKVRSMPEALRVLAERLDADKKDSEEEALYEQRRLALKACMEKMSPRSRNLIDLRYFGQMKPKQISEYLKISITNVHQTLYRIRSVLGDCISKHLNKEVDS